MSLKQSYPGRKKEISFDQLAKKLGYSSPRIVSMVLNGQRAPSQQMIIKIASALKLDSNQRAYLEDLQKTHVKIKSKIFSTEVGENFSKDLTRLETNTDKISELNLKEFEHVSEWYFAVLTQLIASNNNSPKTKDWLFDRVKHSLEKDVFEDALQTLHKRNFITKTKTGYITQEDKASWNTGNTIPSKSIKRHHAQALQCAVNELYTSPIEKRMFQSLVLAVSKEDYPEAMKSIQSFVNSFRKKYGSSNSDHICRLNVQLFEHIK